jgi:hypothetical protein
MSELAARFSKLTNAASRVMLPLVLLVFAIPFTALMFYSVPAADDFCNASLSFNTVPQNGVLALTWAYYTQWSPRWVSYFLLGGSMSHGNLLHSYGWLLLLVALTNLAALWYFFSTIFKLSRSRSFLVAAVFYATWIVILGSPDQQLYWLSDVMIYNLSLSTLLVLIALLLRPRARIWYYGLVALLSIAVPAQHEVAGTFLCMAVFAASVVATVKKLPRSQWYLSLIASSVSMAIVMRSPGNAIRAVQEHKHLWDIAHFPRWLAHSAYHGIDWLAGPALLVSAFCILLLCQQAPESSVKVNAPSKWIAAAGLLGMFAIVFECALTEVATGTWLPDRVAVWFQFIFMLLFVCLVVCGAPEIYGTRFSPGTRLAVFTLFSVTLLGSANFRAAVEDVRGPAEAWWRIEDARLSQRGGTLEYEAPAAYPQLAKPQKLVEDSGCWVNRCLANYLHAQNVIVKNSKEECPH